MAGRLIIEDIEKTVLERRGRSIVGWNRLEGRPRTQDMTAALGAEVRDALWMLTRQWQMGEFKGDDAGSPIAAVPIIESAPLERFRPNIGAARPYDPGLPPEMRVESRPLAMTRGGAVVGLDMRLLMGRHWLKLIGDLTALHSLYRQAYPVKAPVETDRSQAAICAHAETWQVFSAAAGRMMDGYALYRHLTITGAVASDGIAMSAADRATVDAAGAAFFAWFHRQFVQPDGTGEGAWREDRLEYRFAVSAPTSAGETVFEADEYFHGHLDWYNFDIAPEAERLGATGEPALEAAGLVPMPISFPGMPDTRWWAFEDGRTNLGKIDLSTAEIGRLLFLEFALVYANDWYMMPLSLPADAYAKVRGVAVTNVFGERFWVAPAGEGIDDDWRRWTMFTASKKGEAREVADTGLFMNAVVPKIQEGKPLEEVLFTRDEMANMVWAIEKTVPLAHGRPRPGREAARQVRAFHERIVRAGGAVPPDHDPVAPLRYEIMSTVEEHWIPFVAARRSDALSDILLQRGSMLRVIDGDPDAPRRVMPQTATLREGLDASPRRPYFVEEEEVPRSGARVTRSFQRTRWHFGRTFTWVGMRKQVGRGEGSSGLAFDSLLPQPFEPEG